MTPSFSGSLSTYIIQNQNNGALHTQLASCIPMTKYIHTFITENKLGSPYICFCFLLSAILQVLETSKSSQSTLTARSDKPWRHLQNKTCHEPLVHFHTITTYKHELKTCHTSCQSTRHRGTSISPNVGAQVITPYICNCNQ